MPPSLGVASARYRKAVGLFPEKNGGPESTGLAAIRSTQRWSWRGLLGRSCLDGLAAGSPSPPAMPARVPVTTSIIARPPPAHPAAAVIAVPADIGGVFQRAGVVDGGLHGRRRADGHRVGRCERGRSEERGSCGNREKEGAHDRPPEFGNRGCRKYNRSLCWLFPSMKSKHRDFFMVVLFIRGSSAEFACSWWGICQVQPGFSWSSNRLPPICNAGCDDAGQGGGAVSRICKPCSE